MNRWTKRRNGLFDSLFFLAMIGIFAGALGGLGIGLMTGRTASTTTSSTGK